MWVMEMSPHLRITKHVSHSEALSHNPWKHSLCQQSPMPGLEIPGVPGFLRYPFTGITSVCQQISKPGTRSRLITMLSKLHQVPVPQGILNPALKEGQQRTWEEGERSKDIMHG